MSGKVMICNNALAATTGAVGALQVETTIPVRARRSESAPRSKAESTPPSCRRVPRITRLMALAIKFQAMIERGEIRDYADIARLGHVTPARVTQIMNLLHLAPDIQEELLSPTGELAGERRIRRVISAVDWREQRRRWRVP